MAFVLASSLLVSCATGPVRTDKPDVFWTTVFAEVLKGLLGPSGGWTAFSTK